MNNETVMPEGPHVRSLYHALFFDMAQRLHGRHFSDDLHSLLSRYEKEGESFLCQTLPLLGKAIEISLISQEKFILPAGWRRKKGTSLPVFLNEILQYLFEKDGQPRCKVGLPTSEEQYWAVLFSRQITLLFSKVDGRTDEMLADEVVAGFKTRTTRQWEPDYSCSFNRYIYKEARHLLHLVFTLPTPALDQLHQFRKKPWGRHGPGAVAMSERGSEKWSHYKWPGLHEDLFSWSPKAVIPEKGYLDCQPPSRVVTVPKDFRGPRVICIEPKENQFAQQGLMDILYRHISRCKLTRRSINFDDVEPSRVLCRENGHSTIDLKDASDNISLSLARLLLPKWVFALVTRYRTRMLSYKGDMWRSTCLASMGNATCFPLETLIFWAIARAAENYVFYGNGYHIRKKLPRYLRVFGDDIICPEWAFDVVCQALEACGSVVNRSKSCHMTPIKESCGEYTFSGRTCRIVRMRSTHVKDHRTWLQFLDYAVQANDGKLPAFAEACHDLAFAERSLDRFKKRYNRQLQRREIRIPQFVVTGRCSRLSDYVGLYAWHVGNDTTPSSKGARKRVKWKWVDLNHFIVTQGLVSNPGPF